ncbi:unnamed protein product [Trichobilharzia regenti]|nr:unnamed protein product [Trichobilharzia regenti]
MVISTAVGGLPEVLPEHFIRLAPAKASELASVVADSIIQSEVCRPPNPLCRFSLATNALKYLDGSEYQCNSITDHCWHMHKWIRGTYSWRKVAKRTEKVYTAAMSRPTASLRKRMTS